MSDMRTIPLLTVVSIILGFSFGIYMVPATVDAALPIPDSPDIRLENDSMTVGEDLMVWVIWEEEFLLEVEYPNTEGSWVLRPASSKGGNHTFKLPGPYTDGNVTCRTLFDLDEESGIFRNFTEIEVSISGWSDLDGDGLEDSWESLYGLEDKETDHDPDDDGLDLIGEMYNLTDPTRKDTDGDSMDDLWEVENGTLPFRDDPNDDPDMDGWSNIREWSKDTDPRDPSDHPEELPVTPWYWILLIVIVLFLILGYFVKQLFSKRKLEDDLEDFDSKTSSRSRRP